MLCEQVGSWAFHRNSILIARAARLLRPTLVEGRFTPHRGQCGQYVQLGGNGGQVCLVGQFQNYFLKTAFL